MDSSEDILMAHREAPARPQAARLGEAGAGLQAAPHASVLMGPWQLAMGALAITAFIANLWTRAPYDDYWWLLATGRFIVAHRALPVPDSFSFTAMGRTWPAHEWLSALIMYFWHNAFGDGGTLTAFSACTALTIFFTFSTLRRIGTRLLPAAAWTFALIWALWPSLGPYPQVMAFTLLAVEIWLIERWLQRRDRAIWLVPVVVWLWGNLHGSFIVALAIPTLLLLGESLDARLSSAHAARLDSAARRQLALLLGISVLDLTLNPNGPSIVLYPITPFHNPLNQYIAGLAPLNVGDPRAWPFALLAGSYLSMIVVRRPRVPLADLLTAAAFTAGALFTWRFEPFAAIALVLAIGRVLTVPNESGARTPAALARLLAWREARGARATAPSVAQQGLNAGILAAAALVVFFTRPTYDPAGVTGDPVAAVDTLGSAGLPGPLFNDFNWGGYLIWRLWPQTHVFVDGRGIDLYTSGGVLRQYLDVVTLQSDAETILDRYEIRTILFERDTPLARYLAATGRWRTTYDDGHTLVFERQSP